MHRIAAAHEKSGQGKTTFLVEVMGTLTRRGARVLAMDFDGQGSLTQWLLGVDGVGRSKYASIPDAHALTCFFKGGCERPDDVFSVVKAVPGLVVVPANPALEEFEHVPREKWLELLNKIQIPKFLDLVEDHFDFCFMDTPGKFGFTTRVAVAASHRVFTPCKPESMCVDELIRMRQLLEEVNQHRPSDRPPVRWGGVIPSCVTPYKEHKRQVEIMEAVFKFDPTTGPNHVFKQHFKERQNLKRAPSMGMPFCIAKPSSPEAKMVMEIAEQIAQLVGFALQEEQPQPKPKPKGRKKTV